MTYQDDTPWSEDTYASNEYLEWLYSKQEGVAEAAGELLVDADADKITMVSPTEGETPGVCMRVGGEEMVFPGTGPEK